MSASDPVESVEVSRHRIARATARLRVGMYTTVGERCGIADYTRTLTEALAGSASVTTIPIAPGRRNPIAQVVAGLRLGRHDVAHVQHTYSFFGVDALTYTILFRLLRASIAAPLVLTAHTVRPPGPTRYEGRLGSWLANALDGPRWHDVDTFRGATVVISHSRLHRERLVARGVPAARCVVIPHGVPRHVVVDRAARDAFRSRHGLADGPVVGVFGFLEPSKRFTDLVTAVAAMPATAGRKPSLLIAGGPRLVSDDSVTADLTATAMRAGLDGRFSITGYLDRRDVPVALETMDIVVVPYATDDSVSYSLHLALAQHRPVLATDLAAMREVQERGECLALVPAGDAGALTETLGTLLDSETRRRALSDAARGYSDVESAGVAAERTLAAYALARSFAA